MHYQNYPWQRCKTSAAWKLTLQPYTYTSFTPGITHKLSASRPLSAQTQMCYYLNLLTSCASVTAAYLWTVSQRIVIHWNDLLGSTVKMLVRCRSGAVIKALHNSKQQTWFKSHWNLWVTLSSRRHIDLTYLSLYHSRCGA